MSPVRWLLVALLAVGTAGCCCGTCKTDKAAEAPQCSGCASLKSDPKGGWCESCNKGFVSGKEVACKGCATAAASGGTCKACAK